MKQKLKNRRSINKRFSKLTRSGQLVRLSTSAQHLATNKKKRTRRQALEPISLSKGDQKRLGKYLNL